MGEDFGIKNGQRVEHLSCGEKLRSLVLLSLESRRFCRDLGVLPVPKVTCNKGGTNLLAGFVLMGEGEMALN